MFEIVEGVVVVPVQQTMKSVTNMLVAMPRAPTDGTATLGKSKFSLHCGDIEDVVVQLVNDVGRKDDRIWVLLI